MSLSTPDACQLILGHRTNQILISTMSAMRAVDRLSTSHRNLGCVPLMGGAAGLGLGIALARSDEQVVILDGDGSLLMQLGVLATIADQAPSGLLHFVFRNDVWFEGSANIRTPGATKASFAGFAQAAGYPNVRVIGEASSLDAAMPELLASPGPTFVELRIDPEAGDRGPWGTQNPQAEIQAQQFTRMGEEARRLRSMLAGAGHASEPRADK